MHMQKKRCGSFNLNSLYNLQVGATAEGAPTFDDSSGTTFTLASKENRQRKPTQKLITLLTE